MKITSYRCHGMWTVCVGDQIDSAHCTKEQAADRIEHLKGNGPKWLILRDDTGIAYVFQSREAQQRALKEAGAPRGWDGGAIAETDLVLLPYKLIFNT